MPCLDMQIPAADGASNGTLHIPEGGGPWPGVLVFPGAGGVRETFRQMGDHLAGMGYAALIPDIYYRRAILGPRLVVRTTAGSVAQWVPVHEPPTG